MSDMRLLFRIDFDWKPFLKTVNTPSGTKIDRTLDDKFKDRKFRHLEFLSSCFIKRVAFGEFR